MKYVRSAVFIDPAVGPTVMIMHFTLAHKINIKENEAIHPLGLSLTPSSKSTQFTVSLSYPIKILVNVLLEVIVML